MKSIFCCFQIKHQKDEPQLHLEDNQIRPVTNNKEPLLQAYNDDIESQSSEAAPM